ncbi:hypothetical protein KC19_9G184200 [Ceratodon purpureus]|uniref:DUF7748 domain-containing protein n=1 Tax=Ceratodon purpureus TaxID=3225 RepID=A0A8T0GWZ3_CERPU|nr:hypothetical protein KC19_9G184200 [Ceratodon purpureus]
MPSTKVTNKTGKELILKESTAGIKRFLNVLPDKETHKISVDPNATYREYWCAEKHDDPNAVVLSSDDCQEYKEVTIHCKREEDPVTHTVRDVYSWAGVPRRDNGSRDTSKPGFLKRIFGFFKPAAHDQQVSPPDQPTQP